MDKYEIAKRIEKFAPLETQEEWDCSGWGVNVYGYDEIQKIMLCLTVTEDVIKQAINQNCDMIVSHHPMFYINCHSELFSESFKPKINIYCAHTNLDKAKGGTTDTLISNLKYPPDSQRPKAVINWKNENNDFLRFITFDTPVSVSYFSKVLKQISPNARIINNNNRQTLKTVAFCAGSGSELIQEATKLGAECFVTGDLKFHTALESPILIYDIGHFESEILILPVLKKIIGEGVEIVYAEEKSPFTLI